MRISCLIDSFSQQSSTFTHRLSRTGWMFVASKVNPKIMPSRIRKKIVSIRPKFAYSSEIGRKTKIEMP